MLNLAGWIDHGESWSQNKEEMAADVPSQVASALVEQKCPSHVALGPPANVGVSSPHIPFQVPSTVGRG